MATPTEQNVLITSTPEDAKLQPKEQHVLHEPALNTLPTPAVKEEPTFIFIQGRDDDARFLFTKNLPNCIDGAETYAGSIGKKKGEDILTANYTIVTPHALRRERRITMPERAAKGVIDVYKGKVGTETFAMGGTDLEITNYNAALVGLDDTELTPYVQEGAHAVMLGSAAEGYDVGKAFKHSNAHTGPHAGVAFSRELSTTKPLTGNINTRIGGFVNGELAADTRGLKNVSVGGGARITVGSGIERQPRSIAQSVHEGYSPVDIQSGKPESGDWSVTLSGSATAYPTRDNRFIDGAKARRIVKGFALDASWTGDFATFMAGVQTSDNPSAKPGHGVPKSITTVGVGVGFKL